jgi:hypothetical protein
MLLLGLGVRSQTVAWKKIAQPQKRDRKPQHLTRDHIPKPRSQFVWLSADRNLLKWLTFMVWQDLDDDFPVEFIQESEQSSFRKQMIFTLH